MKGPSLQKTAVISAVLHFTFFIMAALVMRHSGKLVMPSPYVVSLVGPAAMSLGRDAAANPSGRETAPDTEKAAQPARAVEDSKADMKRLEDRLAEMRSKKKVKRIVEARKMITITGQSPVSRKRHAQGASEGTKTGRPGSGSYEDLIASRIGQEIIFPDTNESMIETIVVIRILRDGTIRVQGIEKKSGNALFDRAALRAIEKASPVPVPASEMELGLKLHPYGAGR